MATLPMTQRAQGYAGPVTLMPTGKATTDSFSQTNIFGGDCNIADILGKWWDVLSLLKIAAYVSRLHVLSLEVDIIKRRWLWHVSFYNLTWMLSVLKMLHSM
jgi:hypothetical protein